MAQTILSYKQPLSISYTIAESASKNAEPLVILHGWGATKRLMEQSFKDTFADFTHYYIDLPGFGNSQIPPFALCTQDYAEIVRLFLESLSLQAHNCTILGHSFGGKVATLLNPKELILLSSAGIPTQKSLKTRSKIALTKFLNRFIPSASTALKTLLRSKDAQGMNEIMYQTFKNVVDEDFSDIFRSFKKPCWIFWGRDDHATPLSSGETIHRLIENSQFFALGGDHFFFLKNAKNIEALYNETKSK